MPDIIISGPEGRIEARYQHSKTKKNPPIALFLHPDPEHGGTMNNRVVYTLFHAYARRGYSCLRFNFRGVGKSQGSFVGGEGELSDAAAALDWLQEQNSDADQCWIGGFSFGAWIGMQLLMRRPEITGFISIAPPANTHDFSFLAPCPSSGLILHGDRDEIVPTESVVKLIEKLRTQRGITIDHRTLPGANHFFRGCINDVEREIDDYLDTALGALDKNGEAC